MVANPTTVRAPNQHQKKLQPTELWNSIKYLEHETFCHLNAELSAQLKVAVTIAVYSPARVVSRLNQQNNNGYSGPHGRTFE